ncbi:MAG: O-antigen ligase family protein [Akkermansiaceae bacterium]|nr:O-antigen ligase family protein [Akkermansiaceae bacterium]
MTLNRPIASKLNVTRRKPGERHNKAGFTLADLARNCLLILGLMMLNRLGSAGTIVFLVVLMIWMSKGPLAVLQVLSIFFLAMIANKAFVPNNSVLTQGRFLLLVVAIWQVFVAMQNRGYAMFTRKHVVALVWFCLACAVLTTISRYYVVISLLKIISFLLFTTVLLILADILKNRKGEVTLWFFSIIATSVFLGIVSMGTGVSMNMDRLAKTKSAESFFNGPFDHSQTLGTTAALMIVYLLGLTLFTRHAIRWLSIPLILVLGYFMYLATSRTSLLALGIGILVMLLMVMRYRPSGGIKLKLNFSKSQIITTSVVICCLVFVMDFTSGGGVSATAMEFLVKYDPNVSGKHDTITKELFKSREGQIEMMMLNIRKQPIVGLGFGTSTSEEFISEATLLSAPTEKGFLFLAIVEETGIIGTIFFAVFLISIVRFYHARKNLIALGMFATFLGVNMGEMLFFSFGGQGGFLWVFIVGSILMGKECTFLRRASEKPNVRRSKTLVRV